jgi:hypothetical protein
MGGPSFLLVVVFVFLDVDLRCPVEVALVFGIDAGFLYAVADGSRVTLYALAWPFLVDPVNGALQVIGKRLSCSSSSAAEDGERRGGFTVFTGAGLLFPFGRGRGVESITIDEEVRPVEFCFLRWLDVENGGFAVTVVLCVEGAVEVGTVLEDAHFGDLA